MNEDVRILTREAGIDEVWAHLRPVIASLRPLDRVTITFIESGLCVEAARVWHDEIWGILPTFADWMVSEDLDG